MPAEAILAAEFTNGSKHRSPQLAINRISNGRREHVAIYAVADKREARAKAAQLNAQPWNF
jgi:hypothetical protein